MTWQDCYLAHVNLESHETKQLAEFFARRFPEPHRRAAFAAAARVRYTEDGQADPVHAWEDLIEAAQAARRLAHLARATAASTPEDENLQLVAGVFADRSDMMRRIVFSAAVGGAAGAVALAAILVFSMMFGGENAPDAVLAEAAPAITVPVPAPAAVAASAAEHAPEADAAIPEDQELVGQALGATPVPEAAPELTTEVEPAVQASVAEPTRAPAASGWTGRQVGWANGRCTAAKSGAVVGYWYAGAVAPGQAGSTIEIDSSVNVRADYPDRHNDYDARSDVRCVLKAGDLVRLSKDPIMVPGDRYWVPLVSGDLLEHGSDGSASL